MRIKKFGCQSENAKLNVRAQRFGVTASGGAVKDVKKMSERAQRFGTTAASTPTSAKTAAVSSEVLDKRAKRFGAENAATNEATASTTVIHFL